jgi:N-ethylmaleimide reductase
VFGEARKLQYRAHDSRCSEGRRTGHVFCRSGLLGKSKLRFVVTPDGFSQPSPHRALKTGEIPGIIEQYRTAAVNAQRAGFDGFEVMAAHGHVVDQFLQDNSNKRTDHYGGSIENRTQLLVEIVEALIDVWGANRVGVRIEPSETFNDMADINPRALFRYVAERLNAYLHVIEPRIKGGELIVEGQPPVAAQELSKIFQGPIIAAVGFQPDTAEATVANGDASLISFGRHFIANPDLPKRIELGLPLNRYDRSTFYGFDAHGYPTTLHTRGGNQTRHVVPKTPNGSTL